MWVMVFLPPLLVLRSVGGARNPRVNSGGERAAVGARWSVGNASQGEPHPGHWPQHLPHMQNEELGVCVQALHPSTEKPTCSLVSCGQQHPA